MAEFENPAFEEPDFKYDDDFLDEGLRPNDDVTERIPLLPPAVTDGELLLPGGDEVADGGRQLYRVLQASVDDFYDSIQAEQGHVVNGRDTTVFELNAGRLRLREFPRIAIINAQTGKPLALSTIAKNGGVRVVRALGFADWTQKTHLSAKAAAATLRGRDAVVAAAEAIPLVVLNDADFEATLQGEQQGTDAVETTLAELDALRNSTDPPMSLREIRGGLQAMATIRTSLDNNHAKAAEVDLHISREEQKLDDADTYNMDQPTKRRIMDRLRDLKEERAGYLEAASADSKALRSQLNRIKETLSRMLDENTSLAEAIRTLFREHGITIASILTAIGMTISTLVLALTGGGGGGGAPPTPSDKGGVKEWVKKQLEALKRVLAKLAGKAAAALPGVIGSIVSGLLTFIGKTAGWLADNLWALVLAVGGLLIIAARDLLAKKP